MLYLFAPCLSNVSPTTLSSSWVTFIAGLFSIVFASITVVDEGASTAFSAFFDAEKTISSFSWALTNKIPERIKRKLDK